MRTISCHPTTLPFIFRSIFAPWLMLAMPLTYSDGWACEPTALCIEESPLTGIPRVILFATGSNALGATDRENLERLATVLNKPDFQSVRIKLVGHTDKAGTHAANIRLSHARAQQVMNTLILRGVLYERIEAVGLGESQPRTPHLTGMHQPLNRRVEIFLIP